MIDLSIVIDYYRLLSEKKFNINTILSMLSVGYYWITDSRDTMQFF